MHPPAEQPTLPASRSAAQTDTHLLRQYVQHGSQAAFAALVQRHGRLVYSTCLREVQDASLAEDAAQVVFLLLARKASSLRHLASLSGWLFRTARFASRNVLRQERRIQLREQKTAENFESSRQETAQALWSRLEPLLNDALASLTPKEQEVVLLRYFEGLTWRETANALAVSEDAAQKRCTRALDKMRRFAGSSSLVVSAAILIALLNEHAAHAAPPSPALSLKLAGLSSPHTAHLLQGVTHTMSLIKTAAILGSLTLVGTAAGLGWASHAASLKAARPALLRQSTAAPQSVNLSQDAKTSQEVQEILAQVHSHYEGLNSFSMVIIHSDDSGLYPGAYTQKLTWQKEGRFTLRNISLRNKSLPDNLATMGVPRAVPDFLADGVQVVSVLPNGKRTTEQEAPRPNFMPGWEVTGGFILSWLQNTPNGNFLQSPPEGMTLRWSFGPRTVWHGYKVRELLVRVFSEGKSLDASYFVDPASKSLVGMEAALVPGSKKGYSLYTNQKENMPVPASLGTAW